MEQCLDGFSKYEMQAYVESMQAAYLLEVEKYQEGLDKLLRAKLIYQKVAQYKDSLEAVIYQEKIGQIDTFVRLCCLNLKLASAQDKESKMQTSIFEEISKAHTETKQEKIENIQEVSYNGKSIPLKSERLRQVFKRVENQLADLSDPNAAATQNHKELINNYLKFVNTLDDAQLVIKKEKAEESKKSEQSGQLYNFLV